MSTELQTTKTASGSNMETEDAGESVEISPPKMAPLTTNELASESDGVKVR